MDPVQLMMAAHQADATVAAQTPDQALQAAIAQSRPDLWAPLSTNPAAYPDLLGWLASTGNVEVLANLRARGYLSDDVAANAADSAGASGAAAADAAEEGADADGSGEAGDEQKTDEPEDAEVESPDPEDPHAEDAAVDESADEHGVESAEAAEEPGTEEPAEDSGDSDAAEAATEPDAEDSAEEATDADDSGEAGDEHDTDEPAEDSGAAEDTVDADSGEAGVEPETEEPAEDSENSGDVEGDEAESPDSQDQQVEDAAVDESADERGAESAEAAEEPGTEEPAEDSGDSDEAETAVDPGAETATDEAADSGNNDTTVLATASQRHEVDSADTTDFTASAQSAAVTSGWTAGSAAPAAGSAESVAFPVPPPPSAEDIAAWAETPSGAPSGFSAAQPAVELDMFGPQMMAQMPPPQQKQPAKSNSGRLIAIIVVLLLVIVGGGGLWAGSHFANKDKSEDTSQNKADSDGGEDGKQNGQADAAATSTAAALPSGAVKACSSMPTFTITSVEDGQGELKVHGNMATSCAEGDFLAGSSSQVLVYSSTSPTGGADVDHLVASGTFDLSSDPLIIPNGGRAVTLRFGEQHYFRTAKDLDLKGLTVRPSFDRGSSSTATAKSSTNSAMTIASSASSNANQEAQDEQAAGDAIQWQIKHDYPIVMNSLRGKWTPQLSSKQVGLVADGQTWTKRLILAEYLKTQQANPKAVIIDTSQWPVYDTAGWWVTLQGDSYSDGDQANAWCDAQGYDSDHCLAKRIESNGTSQGTTKLR
ncbi:Uncharacterised protein [Actinomyces naeslundii]|uniref:variant leucine-rich repeat-containing protein n=1 Tax=Actinomyces naeslundii TaxID=1655 RepID=UPI00195B2DC5|nr:hypothetical protein [Actinomyces naeslundii]VTX85051.1 Uncharacterised protein [Actinomyces naeslundii]